MFKSLAIILAVALVANANQDYKSNRMKLLTQTVSARLHGETIPSDQPQFKAVSRTKNLQATIPQGSQMQFQQQPQFVSQSFGSSMPPQFAAPQQPQQFSAPQQPQFTAPQQPQFAAPQQPQQFVQQFQAPSAPQRAASPMEQAQLQQQMQKQQQFQQQQNQINAQKAVQDQQVLQQQQQLIQQQQQQQAIAGQQQQPQPIVPQQPQQQPQFVVSPDASAISGAQAPISPLQQQQLMQQQQQQQMINSQQQSQIPQLQQQQAAQLQQQIQAQRIPQSQPIQQAQVPISQQFVPQQQQQFVPQQQMTQQPQFVSQQPFQQQMPVSQTGLAQTCSTAQPGDLVAHPSSPSSFIICYGFGEFTVMDCPEHLVFNAHTQRCDLTTDVPMGCASNPCMNNGRCTDLTLGQFRCDCPVGFAGIQCERVDACSANTCGGDGVCIALPAGSPVPNACMCNGGRSIGVTCASAEANPCIQPNSNLKLFNVNFNPSLFAHCEGARPNFMFCQAPLIFNAAKQSCDWPSRK